jgi:membrane-associated phospholipid phosphatase
MIELIKENKLYYYLVLAFWSALLLVLFLYAKGVPLLYINQFHNTALDYFFYGITFLGDGLFATILLVGILLFISKRKALVITFSFLSVVIVVQSLKNFLFSAAPRPHTFFEGLPNVYYVPWIEIHGYNSFPSGHTAQAFCLALFLLFYFKNKSYAFALFLLAALAGFSRMYLMQHFPMDVLGGSVLALIVGTPAFYFFEHKVSFLNSNGMDRPLINMQNK